MTFFIDNLQNNLLQCMLNIIYAILLKIIIRLLDN